MIGERVELRQVGPIAIHAIETLDRDPYSTRTAGGSPSHDRLLNTLSAVMPGGYGLGSTAPHPVVNARVAMFVVHDEVASLWSGREKGEICVKAATEIERGFSTEKARRSLFKRRMFWVIASQQARSARAGGDSTT